MIAANVLSCRELYAAVVPAVVSILRVAPGARCVSPAVSRVASAADDRQQYAAFSVRLP